MIEVWKLHSPKRFWVQIHPAVPFIHAGHSFNPVNPDSFRADLKTLPQSGPLGEVESFPLAFPCHKAKASAIWFTGETAPNLVSW